MPNEFTVKPNERVAIVGMTGSGKSFFARNRLAGVRRLVVLDPKGTISAYGAREWGLTNWQRGYKDLQRGRDARLYVPPPLNDEEWDAYLWECYRATNVLVYIDELYGVGPNNGSLALRALYTRGRELDIGVWASTQRPRWVPMFAFSEAEWVIMFRTKLLSDRKYMSELIGPEALTPLQGHGFILASPNQAPVVYKQGLVVKKRRGAQPKEDVHST